MKSFFPTVLLFTLVSLPATAQVHITEFMASNTHTLLDEDGDSSDWIEIQNTSTTNVNLLNWYLTDTASDLTKWAFPSTNLPPGNFMVVFASGKNRRTPGRPLHTNFKLSASWRVSGAGDAGRRDHRHRICAHVSAAVAGCVIRVRA